MASKQTLFRIFYRLGFTPWDGHPLAQSVRDLVEGTGDTAALPTGPALELGCGTGDCSIYLAQHGWHVTAPEGRCKNPRHAGACGGFYVWSPVVR